MSAAEAGLTAPNAPTGDGVVFIRARGKKKWKVSKRAYLFCQLLKLKRIFSRTFLLMSHDILRASRA